MTKVEIFNKIMNIAKNNGYSGEDYQCQIGFVIQGQNINSIIFDSDFNKALFDNSDDRILFLKNLSVVDDKWSYIGSNFSLFRATN